MDRQKIIVRVSAQGILMNLILVGFKAAVGLIAGSVAIVLDAVNNLTDALSSVITIVGTKLAGRAPDKEHPYGHGRVEYMTTLAVGLIVMFAGVTALIEAVPKIFKPEMPDYSMATIVVVAAAVVVKFVFGRYVKRTGEKIQSGSLKASGADAIFDSVLSLSTLVGIFVALIFRVSIDGWLGAVIAVFIVKASIEMLREAWVDIIGRRPDSELARGIKEKVCSFPEVAGAYDLVLHSYGPTEVIGSVHVQVPDKMTAKEIHGLSREIMQAVYEEFRVVLTVGVYAENASGVEEKAIRKKLEEIVTEMPEILQMHGFYVNRRKKVAAFDLIIDFKFMDKREALKNKVVRKLRVAYPKYKFVVTLDADLSD